MSNTIEILFSYHRRVYEIIATISATKTENNIHVELLNAELIQLFNERELTITNKDGVYHLPACKSCAAHSMLMHIVGCVRSVGHVLYDPFRE